MHLLRTSVLLATALLAACAPQTIRADVGAVFARIQGELGLMASTPQPIEINDVLDQLGTGDQDESPYVRLEADWGPHRVKASGFGHNSAGTGVLAGRFGDIAAGSSVASDFDFVNVTGSWSYDLMPTSMFRVAPGVQLGYYSLDLSVRTTGGFETVDTDIVTPMPYLEAEADFGMVAVGANAGVMGLHLRDATGRYWDAEAYVRANPVSKLEVIGGLRYLLFDAHGEATGRDFDADIDVFGWFLGVGVKF